MKKLLTLLLAVFLSSIVPSSAFHADQGNHGFYTGDFKVGRPIGVAVAETADAKFTALSLESLSVGDNTSLSLSTDTDYSITLFVKATTLPGASQTIFRKGNDTVDNTDIEYKLNFQDLGGAVYQFRAFIGDGTATTSVTASTFGNLSTGTWYFVTVIHDKTNDLLKISVNDGSFNTTAWADGTLDSTTGFNIGVDSTTQYLNGEVDQFGFYKDENLSTAEVTSLYASGAGLAYCQLSGSLLTNLQAWWNLSETSGSRADSTASANTLTDNNTVTSSTGVTAGNCL